MKYLLIMFVITLMAFSSYGQSFAKYQGAKIPIGSFWKVTKDGSGSYFQSKMKTEHVYFYVKYLGENLSNEEKSKKTKTFIKEIGITPNLKNPINTKIGTTGAASKFDWTQKNGFGIKASYRLYFYETFERKGKVKNFVLMYEEECESEKYCNKYSTHRYTIQKGFSVK